MARRFLIQRGKPGYLYNYTDALAKRDDMYECDADGVVISAPGAMPVAAGISMRPPVAEKAPAPKDPPPNEPPAPKEPTKANTPPPKDPPKTTTVTEIDFNANRSAMVKQAETLFGEKADYLKANWSRKTIIEEIKKIQAAVASGE